MITAPVLISKEPLDTPGRTKATLQLVLPASQLRHKTLRSRRSGSRGNCLAYTVIAVKLMKMNLKDKYKFVFRNDFPRCRVVWGAGGDGVLLKEFPSMYPVFESRSRHTPFVSLVCCWFSTLLTSLVSSSPLESSSHKFQFNLKGISN